MDESGLGKFLSKLDEMTRGCLFVVDGEGFTINEASEVFGVKDNDIKKHLATARKALIEFSP